MAVWKKLNPETGEYEEIPGANSGGGIITAMDTVGIADAYTTYPMADIADSVSVGSTMTTFTLSGLISGDTITMRRQYNGQGGIVTADGVDITNKIKWSNYTSGTLVLDKAYQQIVVQNYNGYESEATVSRRTADMMIWPGYRGRIVPVVGEEDNNFNTLSAAQFYDRIGGSEARARAKLSGKVVVWLGDSYTVGMGGQIDALAAKYGFVADKRGIVSSTIAGDYTGNNGFNPMHSRAARIVTDYTAGYEIGGVTYGIDDIALVVFMGCANDQWTDTWIGPGPGCWDGNTLCGALNRLYSTLLEGCPKAQLITLMQPSNYAFTPSATDKNGVAYTEEDAKAWGLPDLATYLAMTDVQWSNYAHARKSQVVREMAWKYGTHIVDAFNGFPAVSNPANRTAYWHADHLHMSDQGNVVLVRMLEDEGILRVLGK